MHEASQDMAKNKIDNTILVTARDLINEVFTDIMDDNMIQFTELEREYRAYSKEDKEDRDFLEAQMGTIAVECKAVSYQVKKNFPEYIELWDKLIAEHQPNTKPNESD